jgi:hypothetical protein
MRVGTWNLQQAVPGWSKATAQAELMNSIDADIWCLTEAHGAVVLAGHQITHSTPRPSKPQQRWSAISTRWPITPIQADHEGLALGRVTSPHGPLVVATSVMPWRRATAAAGGVRGTRLEGRHRRRRSPDRWDLRHRPRCSPNGLGTSSLS